MKKIIKKYIIKYLLKYFSSDRSSKNYQYIRDNIRFYLFLRWLSEFVKNEKDTTHVIITIAKYMYDNNLNLPFTDIFVIDNVICVCTARPGFWIGKSGSTIDKITEKINFNIEGKQIHNFKITFLEVTKHTIVDIDNYIKVFRDY